MESPMDTEERVNGVFFGRGGGGRKCKTLHDRSRRTNLHAKKLTRKKYGCAEKEVYISNISRVLKFTNRQLFFGNSSIYHRECTLPSSFKIILRAVPLFRYFRAVILAARSCLRCSFFTDRLVWGKGRDGSQSSLKWWQHLNCICFILSGNYHPDHNKKQGKNQKISDKNIVKLYEGLANRLIVQARPAQIKCKTLSSLQIKLEKNV